MTERKPLAYQMFGFEPVSPLYGARGLHELIGPGRSSALENFGPSDEPALYRWSRKTEPRTPQFFLQNPLSLFDMVSGVLLTQRTVDQRLETAAKTVAAAIRATRTPYVQLNHSSQQFAKNTAILFAQLIYDNLPPSEEGTRDCRIRLFTERALDVSAHPEDDNRRVSHYWDSLRSFGFPTVNIAHEQIVKALPQVREKEEIAIAQLIRVF